jgi:Ras GTPase-activating protein 1
LDRKTAEERLLKAGRSGSFLVRESERKPGNYCISFLSHNAINHFRITAVCGDYYIGGRQFQSLNDLVGYYMKVSSLLQDEQLQFPVAPPEPIEGRRRVVAKYPYEKTPDTDELSFHQGDIFLVEADINDDWFWGRSMRNRHESGLIPIALVEQLEGHLDAYEGRDWFNSKISKEATFDLLMDCEFQFPISW